MSRETDESRFIGGEELEFAGLDGVWRRVRFARFHGIGYLEFRETAGRRIAQPITAEHEARSFLANIPPGERRFPLEDPSPPPRSPDSRAELARC